MSNPNYPAMRWHPQTGENRIFTAPEDVPEGWIDQHPNSVKAAEKPPVEDALPMTRDEIKTALAKAEIPFPKNGKDAALYELLLNSLKDHLASQNIDFDPNADAPTLLKLVAPAQE